MVRELFAFSKSHSIPHNNAFLFQFSLIITDRVISQNKECCHLSSTMMMMISHYIDTYSLASSSTVNSSKIKQPLPQIPSCTSYYLVLLSHDFWTVTSQVTEYLVVT